VPLVRGSAHEQQAPIISETLRKFLDESILRYRAPTTRRPVRQVVALVDNDHVPRRRSEHFIDATFVGSAVDTREHTRVLKPGVAVARCHPGAELEPKAIKLLAYVARQARRRKIENPRARLLLEDVLDQEASLNCLAKPHFVGQQYPLEGWLLRNVVHDARLVRKRGDGLDLEASLGIFCDQEPRHNSREAASRHRHPAVDRRGI
jgi:hypothetical protein